MTTRDRSSSSSFVAHCCGVLTGGAAVEARPELGEMDTQTHRISIVLNEDQAEAMAGGYVPRAVKSMLRELLDFEFEDLRRAERPVVSKQRRGSAGAVAFTREQE